MINAITSILVPMNELESVSSALNHAYRVARHADLKIILFVIVGEHCICDQNKIGALAKEASDKSGFKVEIISRNGDLYEEINKEAKLINPLVIMGVTPKFTISDFIDMNLLKIMRGFRYPVMTVRGPTECAIYKTILLPIHFKTTKFEKLNELIELAIKFQATIRIVTILDGTNEKEENKLLAYAYEIWCLIRMHNLKGTLKTLKGRDPVTMILDYGHFINADLIITLNEELVSIKEFFIGTFAQRLVCKSDIPVLSFYENQKTKTTIKLENHCR